MLLIIFFTIIMMSKQYIKRLNPVKPSERAHNILETKLSNKVKIINNTLNVFHV